MLRLTEIKLPLDHSGGDLDAAIRGRLGLKPGALLRYTIFRRGYDARKPSRILFIYTLDVEVEGEAALLAKNIKHVGPAPAAKRWLSRTVKVE